MNYDSIYYERFGQVNLTNCDKEPIHIPGSIQPHGLLWELEEKELKIIRVSQNIKDALGWDPEEILGKPLYEYASLVRNDINLKQAIHESFTINRIYPILMSFRHKNGNMNQWEAVTHKTKHGLLLEVEFLYPFFHLQGKELNYESLELIHNLKSIKILPNLLEYFCKQFKKISNYDRVMIYRFDEEWNGEVVAEAKETHLQPYLGLRYPSTDIPRQARALYERNLIRIIPDINYQKVPIINKNDLNEPLDMSDSILRSVSPIHIEYLHNMGVCATMTISLIVNGKLWGLIACHHYSPKYISFELRSVCFLLVQFLTSQIESLLTIQIKNQKLEFHKKIDKLLQDLQNYEDLNKGLVQSLSNLFQLIPSDGIALVCNKEIHTLGLTPPHNKIQELIPMVFEYSSYYDVFSTDSLIKFNKEWISFKENCSGILAGIIDYQNPTFILYFRKEVIKTVHWAGDPNKPMIQSQDTPGRLHPRKSFEAWIEKVQNHSKPWEIQEIEALIDFISSIKRYIIKRNEQINNLFKEISFLKKKEEEFIKKIQEKDIFLREIHHRVKNNFQIILSLLSLQSSFEKDPKVDLSLKESKSRIQSMAIVHELLYEKNDSESLNIQLYLEKLINHLKEIFYKKFINIEIHSENISVSTNKLVPFGLILNELILNSFKHAFPQENPIKEGNKDLTLLENAVGHFFIHLQFQKQGRNYLFHYKDNGIGFPESIFNSPTNTMGLILIQNLSKQLQGEYKFWNDGGANYFLSFPVDS